MGVNLAPADPGQANSATVVTIDGVVRAIALVICLVGVLIALWWALTVWAPGGVYVDKDGSPLLVAGQTVPKGRNATDIVAIVGAVTTFLGTALGMFFGVNAGAKVAQSATAVTNAATSTAQQATATAQQATANATVVTQQRDDAIASKALTADAARALLTTLPAAQPHVMAADAKVANELQTRVEALRRTLV